jgi:hypothetical protein
MLSFLDGMLELNSILEGNDIWDESCGVCDIVDFLLGSSGILLLSGLIVFGRDVIFR